MKKLLLLTLTFIGLSFGTGAKYLVITHSNFYNAIQPLAQWKQKKGMPTKVVRLSEISTATPESLIAPGTIRTYIVNAYNTWNPRPEYVLLVGGPAFLKSEAQNNDGYYGDVTGDHLMEIPIGRFSVISVSQCSLLVTKTLGYERAPFLSDTTWFRKGTTIVREDYDSGDTIYYWNDVRYCRALMQSAGYIHVDTFSRAANDSARHVENAITEGRAFVLYRGQGVYNWWPPFAVNPSSMNNGFKLPVVVSATCQTMCLSGSTYLGENLTRAGTTINPKGAVGFFGTTQSGTAIAPYRSAVTKGFFRSVFEDRFYKLGDATKRAKFILDSIYRPFNYNLARYREWNLLGDPELNLWTTTPKLLAVYHNTLILTGPQTFTITVKDSLTHTNISGALVCIMQDTIIYQYNLTNASGQVSFSINPPTPETMFVTVTANNYVPYEKNVNIELGGTNHNVGVISIIEPQGTIASGTNVTPKALVKNYGTYRDTFPVTFKIGSVYNQTINVILNPGDTITKAFPNWTASLGTHSIKVWTGLTTDEWRANDTAFGSVSVVHPHDVGVIAILAPKDTISQGQIITPKAIMKNYGASSETFSATFKIGAGYTQTISSISLGVGIIDTIEFPNWVASVGSCSTKCYTQLAGDNYRNNDTAYGLVYVGDYYQENFEASNGSFTASPVSNAWEWGVPTSGPGSAHSGSNLWATILAGNYANSANWKLTSVRFEALQTNPILKFWHWYSTEPGYDGGNVKISFDGGSTWSVIRPQTGYTGRAPTSNSGIPGESCFMGSRTYWEQVSFTLPVNSGQLFYLRWHFGSDNIIDGAGWYIDDISCTGFRVYVPPPGDVGVMSIQSPTGRLIIGTPQNVTATIKNYGTSQQTFPARATVTDSATGSNIFLKDSTITLMADSSCQITFGQFTPASNKIYKTTVYTALSGDVFVGNDTLKSRARTTPASDPDGAGYVYESTQDAIYGDTVAFEWIDATQGTLLSGFSPSLDDGLLGLRLPFSFPFYGQSIDSIILCTNGFIQFPTQHRTNPNQALPFSLTNNFIGGLWDDLDLRTVYTPVGKVYQYNDPANQFVVFQWDTVPYYNQPNQRNTFEIILYRDGKIKFQYRTVSTTCAAGSTIGIQGMTGTSNRYLQYVYNGTPSYHRPTANTAVLFYGRNDVGTVSILEPMNSVDSGVTITPYAVIANNGPIQQTFDVRFEISDGYSNTQSVTVGGNSQQIVSFADWTARYFGQFNTKCSTRFGQDQNASNDKVEGTVRVRFHDVGAYEITSPQDTQYAGNLSVIAKVKNFYTRTADCSTRFLIRNQGASIVFNQVQLVSRLLPDSVRSIDFGTFPAFPGTYYTQVFTKLTTDDNRANDTLNDSVLVILAVPALNSPNQSETLFTATPSFDWQDVVGATQYQIQVDNDIDFLSCNIDTVVLVSGFTVPAPGLSAGTYYWRVCAGLPASDWSEVREFIIAATPPAIPVLISPTNGALITTDRLTLIWHSVTDADSRKIKNLLRAIEYNLIVNSLDTILSDTFLRISLSNGDYSWRVRAKNRFGIWSDFSPTQTFRVQMPNWLHKVTAPVPTRLSGKYVKDGGALVAVTEEKSGAVLYAFRGQKSNEFYKYSTDVDTWTLPNALESIPFGRKPDPDTHKINKKTPGKGAGLAWNGDSLIYAIKGNGTRELWVYNITRNTWEQKSFLPDPPVKALKGGSAILYFDSKLWLLVGGQKKDSANFFVYDPTLDVERFGTDGWSKIDSMAPSGPYNNVWKDGSCLTLFNNTIYALKGGDKQSYFYKYDGTNWLLVDSIPKEDTIGFKTTVTPPKPIIKKTTVKDGAGIANDGSIIYAVKGGGSWALWKWSALGGWSQNIQDTIPRLNSKSYAKTGAGLVYADDALWLMKGNNTDEFWKYILTEMSNVKYQISKTNINTQTENSKFQIPNSKFTIDVMPNPFTKLTTIRYTVPVSGKVSLKLYNATGRLVETLVDGYQKAGTYKFEIRNSKFEINKGIYFLRYENKVNKQEIKIIKI